MRKAFWQLPLEQLDAQEWEALCDGCGRCCMVKLEDEDSGELLYTDVTCRYLDTDCGGCTVYASRTDKVPDCVQVTPAVAAQFHWLPATCAYRLRANGQPLRAWHPLISGDPQSVAKAGISVAGRVVSEQHVAEEDLEDHVIHWV